MKPACVNAPATEPEDSSGAGLSSGPLVPEEKWAANREKVAFAQAFPGRLGSWAEARGKTIDVVLASGPDSVVLFTDGAFLITPTPDPDPAAILSALTVARPRLEPRYRDAFATLDRLSERDRDLTRRSKLDKILGALRHNVVEIPELKAAVQQLLDEWNRTPTAHG